MLQELEAASDITIIASVTLHGAQGWNAAKINQQFAATEERVNGAPVFVGVDDSSQCLCIDRVGDCMVQLVEYKGQNTGCAYVRDEASLLDPAAQWMVNNNGFENQNLSVSIQQDIRTGEGKVLWGKGDWRKQSVEWERDDSWEDQSVQVSVSSALSCEPDKLELRLTKPDVSEVVHSVMDSVASQVIDRLHHISKGEALCVD